MKLRLLLPLAGLVLVAAIQPAPVDEMARAKELLKPFAGKWDSEMSFMGMPASKGTEEVTLFSDGSVAMMTATGDMPGGSFEGRGMLGYDPNMKVWQHVWADNQGPGLYVTQGKWSEDGKTFTIETEMDFGMGNGPQKVVMVQTITGADTREFKMRSADAKTDMPPMVVGTYKRAR